MAKARLVEVAEAWKVFCSQAEPLLGQGTASQDIDSMASRSFSFKGPELGRSLRFLCEQGLGNLVTGYFMDSLERLFKHEHIPRFWSCFDNFLRLESRSSSRELNEWIQAALPVALSNICSEKSSQEIRLNALIKSLEANGRSVAPREGGQILDGSYLLSSYQTMVTALLLTTAPKHFSELLKCYFTTRLEEFSRFVRKGGNEDGPSNDDAETASEASSEPEDMELNGKQEPDDMEGVRYGDTKLGCSTIVEEAAHVAGEQWVAELGSVVTNLRQLGFAALCEEAYASAIFSFLKAKIHAVANKGYEKPALSVVKQWTEAVPMQFLYVILGSSGAPVLFSPLSSAPSPLASLSTFPDSSISKERVIRWRLRLQFFTYETLGDLRIAELFDIIVDFPESLPAIEDLRRCLENTGQHSKLVESFRAALRQRLLTAGAATTDILTHYVSTIKALKTMDPTGIVLEAVAEPIREYLRGRKDTIRCIVTMLTEDTSVSSNANNGGAGESLLEELSKGVPFENVDSDDEVEANGDEAWAAAQRWEPDPVEADPSRTSKSRRSMDIISMLVGIYGSKELFVNEYRVMLAEKLLNRLDCDMEREIRTLELLKLRFGENNMHSCEIMLKDLADSKRINTNVKASAAKEAGPAPEDGLSVDKVEATIISALFWPPLQGETLIVPKSVDDLLEDYARRYHVVKTPRKLQWKKHLGTVKLELQFDDRSAQFVVSPMQASIILHFETCSRWSASNLARALGIPLATLRRRIMLWINQGVLVETQSGNDSEIFYEVVENLGGAQRSAPGGQTGIDDTAVPLLDEDETPSAVASVEDQWQQEMNVYESYVLGMLTNFDSLPLDRIHNMLKMFVSDPPYDKTLQQLQGFLGRLLAEEKLEIRDGTYRKKS